MNFRISPESFIYVDSLSKYEVTLDWSLKNGTKFGYRYALFSQACSKILISVPEYQIQLNNDHFNLFLQIYPKNYSNQIIVHPFSNRIVQW